MLERSEFSEWVEKTIIVHLLKHREKDRSGPKSYRPISLLPVLIKALEYMNCLRIREKIEPRMNENQLGFMVNKSTMDAILRRNEWTESRKKSMYGVFLDILAAFDNTWWLAI